MLRYIVRIVVFLAERYSRKLWRHYRETIKTTEKASHKIVYVYIRRFVYGLQDQK